MIDNVTEAHVIVEDLAPMTGLDVMVSTISEQAAILAEQYKPHEISGDADYKDSKKARASARTDIATLKADYSSRMKVIRDAVKDADARVRAALAPLDAIDGEYKQHISAYEDAWTEQRLADLQETYEEYAPALVALVPLSRLVERYGNETGSKWLLRSTNIERAKQLLCESIDRVADGEKLVTAGVEPDDLESAKADYFSTLDHNGAITRAKERKAQRERVRQLEEERRAREEQQRAMREQAARQAEQQAAQQQPKPPIIDTRTVLTREQYEEELAQVSASKPMPMPARTPLTEHQRMVREVAGAQTYVVVLYAATPKQVQLVGATLKANGIHGVPARTGKLLSNDQCADLAERARALAQLYDAPTPAAVGTTPKED